MAVLSLVISHYSMTDLLIFCHNLYSILCPLLTSFMIYMNREFPNRWLSVVIVGCTTEALQIKGTACGVFSIFPCINPLVLVQLKCI